jgi:small subunit ribosomal protein S35
VQWWLTGIELTKPFEYPGDDQVLRFRYTTYFGEEHPAASKVVVEWSPEDITKLTQVQKNKLIKLAGVRYNPETKVIKMSCESFETQAQNKRYLGDLVEVLIKEAQDAKDTFEDIPFDFRHHKPKVYHTFPEEWKQTLERKADLEAKRQARLEQERVVDALLGLPGGEEDRARKEQLRAVQIEVNIAAKEGRKRDLASKLSPALIMDQRARRHKVLKAPQ